MNKTIKEIFDSKYFQGRLTHEEAVNLCIEELTNTGKPRVYIWYLFEGTKDTGVNGRLHGHFLGQSAPDEHGIGGSSLSWGHPICHPGRWIPGYFHYMDIWHMDIVLTRKNPHTLLELARVAILDNCNGYCCLRSLIEKIDEFEIPRSEKEELKKLARGFEINLVEKIPNELSSKCIHN